MINFQLPLFIFDLFFMANNNKTNFNNIYALYIII